MADRFTSRWDSLDSFGLEMPFAGEALVEPESEFHFPAEAEQPEAENEALAWLALEDEQFEAEDPEWPVRAARSDQSASPVRQSASGGQLWTFRDGASKARVSVFVPPAASGQSRVDVLFYAHGLLGNGGPPKRGGEALIESSVFQLAAKVVASGRQVVLVVPLLQTENNKSWNARGCSRPSGLNRLIAAALAEVGAKTGGPAPALGSLFVAGHSRGYGILYPLIRALATSASPASLIPSLRGLWMLDASYPKWGGGFPDAEIGRLSASLPGVKIAIAFLKGTLADPLAAGFSVTGANLHPLTAGRGLQHGNVPARALPIFLGSGGGAQSAVQKGQEAMAHNDRMSGDFEDHMVGMDEALDWNAGESNFADSEDEYFADFEGGPGFEAEMLDEQEADSEWEHECEDEQTEWEGSFEAEEEWEQDREDEDFELEAENSALSLLLGQGEDVAMGTFDWLLGTAAFLLGPTLKRGSKGPGVAFLQRLMQRLGQSVSMDMKFGPGTQRALQSLQPGLGLQPTGEADAATKAALIKALNQRASQPPNPTPAPGPNVPTGNAQLVEKQGGIRKLPISDRLRELLIGAANDAGVDVVHVTSGGQVAIGDPTAKTLDKKATKEANKGANRLGSTRHDSGMAADLKLKKDGRTLDFTKSADLPIFEAFVTAAARRGATGIGAAEGYMGKDSIHVGFGKEAYWGADLTHNTAPAWLKAAYKKGRSQPAQPQPAQPARSPSTGGQTNPPSPNGPQLTREQLIRIMPGSENRVDRYVGPLNDAMNRNAIRTVAQKAAFLGQIAIESGNLRTVVENLNYSAERLAVVWPSRFRNPEVARRYANNPERLGNFVYAGRLGNGNEASGDGFRYRGRGLIQLTGRGNYRAEGFEANPEALLDPANAANTAASFWARRGLNARTPQPLDHAGYRDVTISVNGAARSANERWTVYQRALVVLGNP